MSARQCHRAADHGCKWQHIQSTPYVTSNAHSGSRKREHSSPLLIEHAFNTPPADPGATSNTYKSSPTGPKLDTWPHQFASATVGTGSLFPRLLSLILCVFSPSLPCAFLCCSVSTALSGYWNPTYAYSFRPSEVCAPSQRPNGFSRAGLGWFTGGLHYSWSRLLVQLVSFPVALSPLFFPTCMILEWLPYPDVGRHTLS